MKRIFYFTVLALFIFSCKQKGEAIKEENPTKVITLIVNQYNQIQFGVPSLYIFKGVEEITYLLKNSTEPDTITFEVSLPFTEVAYFHSNGFDYSYPAQDGDTITIDFVNNLPLAKTTSKVFTSNDMNWQVNFQQKVAGYNDKPLIYYQLFVRDTSVYIDILNNLQQEIVAKNQYLDSLSSNACIDKNNYLWQLKSLSVFEQIIKFEKAFAQNKSFNYSSIINDSLLILKSYRGFMRSISLFEERKLAKRVYNPKLIFDRLCIDSLITGKTKYYLLYTYLKDIAENNSTDEFSSASEVFFSFVKDTNYLSLLDRITPISLKNNINSSNNLELIDSNFKTFDFSSVLSGLKSNVVYVDFWASWCAPCRQAMPSAKKLRDDYKGKGVKFIYISLDKNLKSWENGIQQCNLENNAINYLATNFEKSGIYKDLKINSIPRYLIYKDGKLLEANAPSPESNVIRKLLDKYLKE